MNTQKILLLFAFLFLTRILYAYTERDLLQKAGNVEYLSSALIDKRNWVPYPAYTDRQGWDNLFGDNKEIFIRQGEKYLDYEWRIVKATDYLEFERSGNRRIMENPFSANNEAIAALFIAELAEGKGRFIDQLINGVFQSCEMTSWVLSAHLSAQTISRSLPDYREHVIDLTSGDLSSLLAWVWYYMKDEFDKVNPIISRRLKKELKERTLDTYMNTDRFWWMAFNYKPGMMVNNWNPWCNFNVLQTALLIEDDKDALARLVYRTMVSVDKFINYTHSDGACEEGPSYWGHAAGKMYDYLQLLHDATGGQVSLFREPIIKNMGEYIARSYVGNGWVVNFADASARGGGEARLIYRYGKATGSRLMTEYAGYQYHRNRQSGLSSGRDVFRTLQSLLYESELSQQTHTYNPPVYTWYPETEVCYMRNKNGFFFAGKGGYNNESHNHNDIGTFSLYLNNTPIIIDAGVGTYTRQTFSNERYTIWTMQGNYHNIPMINGVPQAFGGEYKAKSTQFNSGKMNFSLDISDAYPEETAVKSWKRSYTLSGKGLQIEDTFDLQERKGADIINFLSWGKIDINNPGRITIQIQNEQVVLSYDKELFTPSIETISLDDARLSNVWGSEIYRISLTGKNKTLKGSYKFRIDKK